MATPPARQRATARLLVTDPLGHVLLFHFAHREGALAGVCYWATPGGGVEAGETPAAAALRELREETGIIVASAGAGAVVARRQQHFVVDSGDIVADDEHYFHVPVARQAISHAGWTDYERACMTTHRWWSMLDLAQTCETIWPQDLSRLLAAAYAQAPQTT